MIPKLSDVILWQLKRMLELQTKPQIILHTDTGQLEFKLSWTSQDAEANFELLKEEYVNALQMEASFKNGNQHTQAP